MLAISSRKYRNAICFTAMLAAGIAPLAHAQDANQSEEIRSRDDSTLGEIVVTAQKREQSINDVGMTIQAFSDAALTERRLSSVEDLTRVVPGLNFAKGLLNSPVYTLRGVGYNDTSLGALPAVTVYVDQVPLIFPALSNQAGLDLERVEVLKGPQGTLFGQNSTGGAINFIAAKPTRELHSGFDVSYGRFNSVEGSGFVSGPLSDTLRARVAVRVVNDGPWQQGYTVDRETGATRTQTGRLLLDWTPVDFARFNLSLSIWHDNSDPQAGQLYEVAAQAGSAPPRLASYPLAPHNARAADTTPGYDPHLDELSRQAALHAQFDLTGNMRLISLTSYVNYRQSNHVDADGMTLQALQLNPDDGKITSFTQELRLENTLAQSLRLVGGANFERDRVYESTAEEYPDSTIGINTPLNLVQSAFYSDQKMQNYALFGNAEWDISSQVTANIGARYTHTRDEFSGCNHDDGDGRTAAFFTFLSQLLTGTTITPIAPGGCFQLGSNFLPAGVYHDRLDENNVSWRAGINYKPVDHLLLYFDAAKGYKSGEFPQLASSSVTQLTPIQQESVMDFEGGFKMQLLDDHLSINGAGFHYNYKNKQLRGTVLDPVFGLLNKLVNIPKSTLDGGELEIAWRPLAGLTASAAATYLETKVTQFVGLSSAGTQTDFAGTPLPFAPKWQFATDLDYQLPVGKRTLLFGVDTTYNSHTFGEIGGGLNSEVTALNPDPADQIKGYFLLDLRAGLRFADDKATVMLWGRNVTNTYYWNNALLIYDQKVRYTGKPATYGVSFSYRY